MLFRDAPWLFTLMMVVSVACSPGYGQKAAESQDFKTPPSQRPPRQEYFIEMHALMVPIVQGDSLKALYAVELVIEAKKMAVVDEIRRMLPKIHDALYADLYGILSLVWSPTFQLPMKAFKKRLRQAAEKVVGPGKIKDVLIQSFHKQYFDKPGLRDYRSSRKQKNLG